MADAATAPAPCPECATPLRRDPAGSHRLECPACGGSLYGLSPFEQLLADGAGARLWVASKDGPAGGRCPWCERAMTAPTGTPDAPPGLTMCHLCQQVWVPAAAGAWMAAHGAPSAPAPGAAPAATHCATPAATQCATPAATQCANCGAPLSPDDMGRCRYCRAQIAAPRPVVVELQPAADPLGGGLLSDLARLLQPPG